MAKAPNVLQPKNVEPKATSSPAPITRKAKADRVVDPGAPVATKVFIHVVSSGARGSLALIPLHEVPLLRRKLQAFGESLQLLGEYPEHLPRERPVMRAELQTEYDRLTSIYVFTPPDSNDPVNLVVDLFGPFQGGRYLVEAMNAVHEPWLSLEKHCTAEDRDPTPEELLDVISAIDASASTSDTIEADL